MDTTQDSSAGLCGVHVVRGGEKRLETNGNKGGVRTAITRSSRVSGLKRYVKGILGLTGKTGIQSVSDVQGLEQHWQVGAASFLGSSCCNTRRVSQDGERERQRAQENTGISDADRVLGGGAQRLRAGKPDPPGQEASAQGTELPLQPHGSPGSRPSPAASLLCLHQRLNPSGSVFSWVHR